MESGEFSTFKQLVRTRIERLLADLLLNDAPAAHAARAAAAHFTSTVRKAAWYAASGGHRWRAMTVIAAGGIFDGDAIERCMPVGVAIELAHAASLVLDDLPSMDDGKLRRGRPCTHIRFADSPWATDMVPLYMVNLAYQIALENERTGYRERVESASEMASTSHRMIVGQEMDVTQFVANGGSRDEHMLACYVAKSGALYGSAAKVGALTCGADPSACELLYTIGMDVGLAYQMMDDVCDVTASSAQSGKNPGQDSANKCTAVDLFGVDGARARAEKYKQSAIERLTGFGAAAETLREIARNASWAPA